MSTLSNRSLDASYIELLKIDPTGGVNTGISASLANVETGNGTASALRLSSAQVHSTGTLTSAGLATLNSAAVTNNATIGGTLGVTGLLTATGGVSGALTGNVNGNVAGDLSGNVTGNLTGNVNGTIGATTPNSGSFTTLGASGASTLSSLSATNLTVSGEASFTGSGGLKMPVGATAGATGRPAVPVQGMLRYNTSLNQFEGYDGSSWAPIASGGGGGGGGGQTTYVRQTFTATASQTTFTITGGYTAYKLDVFKNGVKLVNSDVGVSRDVDVSNGSTIVLATGAAVGDVVDVIGLSSGNFAGPATARRQTYTATAGQTVFTVSGGYTVGQLDVFQNGTKLVIAIDVDVSNGSTFTLTTPAVAGDTIEVVGFTAADTVSGTLQFQAGTQAAPAITTFGDTNTGIFFPAADTLAATTNGTERLRIDSAGNVGIGGTTPLALLHVSGGVFVKGAAAPAPAASATSSLSIGVSSGEVQFASNGINNGVYGSYNFYSRKGDSADSLSRMVIDSSGQVGIGVTPSAWGASEYKAIQVGIGGSISGRVLAGDQDKVNVAANIYHDGASFKYIATDSASIYSQTGGFHIFSNAPSGTAGNTATLTESLRIDSSGNVGVNTTSPSAKLDVRTTGNAWAGRFLNSTALGTPAGVQIVVGQDSTNAVLDVAQGTDYTTTTSLLRVNGNGNVGIGNDNPAVKLEVNGPVRIGSGNDFQFNPTLLINGESTGATGYLRLYTNTTERLRIDGSGNVLVGTTTAVRLLTVAGSIYAKSSGGAEPLDLRNGDTTGTRNFVIFRVGASNSVVGAITTDGANTSYSTSSDYRLKINLEQITNGITRIKQLPVYRFNWISNPDGSKVDGFIAHETKEIVPECVVGEKDAVDADGNPIYQGIDQSKIVPLLTAALKEAISKIEILESKVAALEAA